MRHMRLVISSSFFYIFLLHHVPGLLLLPSLVRLLGFFGLALPKVTQIYKAYMLKKNYGNTRIYLVVVLEQTKGLLDEV